MVYRTILSDKSISNELIYYFFDMALTDKKGEGAATAAPSFFNRPKYLLRADPHRTAPERAHSERVSLRSLCPLLP